MKIALLNRAVPAALSCAAQLCPELTGSHWGAQGRVSPRDVLLFQPQITLPPLFPELSGSIWHRRFPAQHLDLPTDFPGGERDLGGHSRNLLARLSPSQALRWTFGAIALHIPAQDCLLLGFYAVKWLCPSKTAEGSAALLRALCCAALPKSQAKKNLCTENPIPGQVRPRVTAASAMALSLSPPFSSLALAKIFLRRMSACYVPGLTSGQ